MKRVIDNSAGAPGGYWTWVHADTGHKIQHSNYRGITNAVKTFLKANNFPISSQFELELEQNLCAHGARCEDWEPPSVVEKMSTFGRAIYQAAKTWREPLVTSLELQDRREHCTGNDTRPRCNFYAGSTSLLKVACGKCGCTGLKIALIASRCPVGKW